MAELQRGFKYRIIHENQKKRVLNAAGQTWSGRRTVNITLTSEEPLYPVHLLWKCTDKAGLFIKSRVIKNNSNLFKMHKNLWTYKWDITGT